LGILENPAKASVSVEEVFPNIYFAYQEYVRFGGLPIYFKDADVIPLIVMGIKKVIYSDIPYILDNINVRTLKRLESVVLYLATSKPGIFSYDTISSSIGLSKGTVYELIHGLEEAGLISQIHVVSDKSSVRLRKRTKVYFNHPTIRHSIITSSGEAENVGAYREEFFYHHIRNLGDVGYIKGAMRDPDFELKIGRNRYVFEIGKHKRKSNFINIQDSDKAKYPLYVFGFLNQGFSQTTD